MKSGNKGLIAIAKAVEYYSSKGLEISVPLDGGLTYDLITFDPVLHIFKRVQVKYRKVDEGVKKRGRVKIKFNHKLKAECIHPPDTLFDEVFLYSPDVGFLVIDSSSISSNSYQIKSDSPLWRNPWQINT